MTSTYKCLVQTISTNYLTDPSVLNQNNIRYLSYFFDAFLDGADSSLIPKFSLHLEKKDYIRNNDLAHLEY